MIAIVELQPFKSDHRNAMILSFLARLELLTLASSFINREKKKDRIGESKGSGQLKQAIGR